MQDRFKFRIWNKVSKQFASIGINTALTVNNISEDFVVQQCIGLTDKTGRLIYEGDVVRFSAKDETVLRESISEIIYSNACYLTKTIVTGICKRFNEEQIKWYKDNHNEDVSEDIDYFSPTDEYGTYWKELEVIASLADNHILNLEGKIIADLTTIEDLHKLFGLEGNYNG